MKFALSVLAVAGLTYSMTFGAAASSHAHISARGTLRSNALHFAPLRMAPLGFQRVSMQTGSTGTPTTTPTTGPTAAPTPTSTSTLPDPVTLLGAALQKIQVVNSVTFTEKESAEQTNTEKLSVNASGVATCKADYVYVTASDNLIGVSKKKVNYWFEQTLKDYFKKQVVNDKTHHTWKKVSAKATYPFGASVWSVDNPLPCFAPAGSSGSGSTGSGSGGGALRDLTTSGPVTFAGASAWDLVATDDTPDSQGNPQHVDIHYYVSVKGIVLLGIKADATSPNLNITESFVVTYKKPGKKVTIPKIKVGSKKP